MTAEQPSIHPVYLPVESARAVQIEMVFSQDGPAATADTVFKGLAWGSAFLYEVDGQCWLITARHNVTGRHWQDGSYLGEMQIAPTHLVLGRLPKPVNEGWQIQRSEEDPRVGEMQMNMPLYRIPLIGEDLKPLWLEHPILGPKVDVVALRFEDNAGLALLASWKPPGQPHDTSGIAWPPLAAGQDVFIIGYPLGLTSGPLLPLWMRGTIASEPAMAHQVDETPLPLMLIDARTRKGSSGSAVIRHRPEGIFVKRTDGAQGITTGPVSEIVGVYSGRTHADSDLGFVWRIDDVDVICRQGVPGTP